MKKEDLKKRFNSRTILFIALSFILGLVALITIWFWKAPLSGHGGLPFLKKVELSVPPFFQEDPRWSNDSLGGTADTLGTSGCAVTSASMILAYYGIPIDPKKLNMYLTKNNGYENSAWIKWEVAGRYPPNIAEKRYEDLPSYGLIDWNLLWGNPVTIKIRRPKGTTHFVVIVGKDGFDYLIRDPAPKGIVGIYPFYKLQTPIEALRFYRKK
jgi:hypothetical protein